MCKQGSDFVTLKHVDKHNRIEIRMTNRNFYTSYDVYNILVLYFVLLNIRNVVKCKLNRSLVKKKKKNTTLCADNVTLKCTQKARKNNLKTFCFLIVRYQNLNYGYRVFPLLSSAVNAFSPHLNRTTFFFFLLV